MMRTVHPIGVFTVLAMGGLGCAPQPCHQDPNRVLQEYATALRAGNAEAAWALLSEETKQSTTFEVFRSELERDPAFARQLADLMEQPVGPPIVTAQLGAPDADPVEMLQVDGKWRIRVASLTPYSQSSPMAALRSFARALKQKRYDVLLRLAPSKDRRLLSEDQLRQAFEGPEREEVAALSQALEAAFGYGRLEVHGELATFDLGAGSTVELVLDGGAWCIENYRP